MLFGTLRIDESTESLCGPFNSGSTKSLLFWAIGQNAQINLVTCKNSDLMQGARYYIDSIVRYIDISILDTDTFFVSDTSIPIPILDLDLSQFLIETILEILISDTLSVFARSVIIIFTLNSLISPFQFSP